MNTLYLKSKPIKFSASDLVGEGGEAEVYRLGADEVVKIFKQENHRDFANLPKLKRIAVEKHNERQDKLPALPFGLPKEVVLPKDFLYDRATGGDIMAFSMAYIVGSDPVLSLGRRDFRESRGIDNKRLKAIFAGMHATLHKVHAAGVVVGDLNGLNVLVRDTSAYFIDSDSMQFGKYHCSTFCSRYVDPHVGDPCFKQPIMVRPHDIESDWYAFAVMLFEALLYVHPYGGVYRPKNPADRISPEERPLRRISVMHPEVQYPYAAEPLAQVNKKLLEFFEAVFVAGERRIMPPELLDYLDPQLLPMQAKKLNTPAAQIVAGTDLMLTPVFSTCGKILHAAVQGGKLHYVYWEDEKFFRENSRTVMSGQNDVNMRWKISGATTAVGRRNNIFILSQDTAPDRISAELFRDSYPVFDCNGQASFWMDGGKIWKRTNVGLRQIHEVLANQTRFWIGPDCGFGFYQAEQFRRSFIFDFDGVSRFNLAESVIVGNVIDAEVYFSPNIIWVLTTRKEGQELINRCTAIDMQGNVLACEDRLISDDGWLSRIQGKCGAGKQLSAQTAVDYLLSTIDGGVVQIGISQGGFVEMRRFDVPAVSTDDKLIYSEQGLYIWGSNEIRMLSTRPQTITK